MRVVSLQVSLQCPSADRACLAFDTRGNTVFVRYLNVFGSSGAAAAAGSTAPLAVYNTIDDTIALSDQ